MRSFLRCFQGRSLAARVGRILVVVMVIGGVADIQVPGRAQASPLIEGSAPTPLVAGNLYLYNTNGSVRDVTAQYQAWGYVLDENGVPMAICFSDDHTILDATRSKVIGFVAAS